MQSWLLAIPYLAVFAGLLCFAWLMGAWCLPCLTGRKRRFSVQTRTDSLFLLGVQGGAGLATISVVAAVAGIAGEFTRATLVTLLFIVGLFSITQGRRACQVLSGVALEFKFLLNHFRHSDRGRKALMLLMGAGAGLFFYSQLTGALIPDMNQDPQWYHLSVPQQWVFDGRFNTYEGVMPSLYPLAAEAIYASVFLWRQDPVICSLLVVCSSAITLLGLTGALLHISRETGIGPADAVVVALAGWVAVGSTYTGPPLQPKNDAFVVMWILLGSLVLWLPLFTKEGRRLPFISAACVSGFLLATGASAKPVGLPLIGLQWVCLLALWWRNPRVWPMLLAWAGAFLAGMLPWMLRGFAGCGMPLFPLKIFSFPTPSAFQPAVAAYQAPMPDLQGAINWVHQLRAFPKLFSEAAIGGQFLVFIYLLIVAGGLLIAPLKWKFYALMLLFQLWLIPASGNMVVFRLLAPMYVLAVPLALILSSVISGHLQPRWRKILAPVLILSLCITVAHRQRLMGQLPTFNWKYKPVLAQPDVEAYASHAEMGWAYLDLSQLKAVIAPEERVLVIGLRYVFYLHRDAVWNDEAVEKGGPQDQWRKATATEAMHMLQRKSIDVVLMLHDDADADIARQLVEMGFLTNVALSPELQKNWAVFRRSYTSSSSPSGSFSPPEIPNFSSR